MVRKDEGRDSRMRLETEGSPILLSLSKTLPEDYFENPLNVSYAELMLDCMRRQRGIGLAAPQVGKNIRMFVMGDEKENFICMNPEIVDLSGKIVEEEEGCLSFPGLRLRVRRPSNVSVKYQDKDGALIEQDFDGKWARCFLHELDHLDGILFTTKVGKVKLKLERAKANKINRRRKRLGWN